MRLLAAVAVVLLTVAWAPAERRPVTYTPCQRPVTDPFRRRPRGYAGNRGNRLRDARR